ncbi:uncharacterized protein MAM_07685 [Metarhizium album ARSEF 1941]|uniref:Uncharacterized protein n=1 Tax=Metarhizium album (strain ARSEF 1941) TaxID=1081103 RepID=A0A0B2WLY2_METAS|nr:uncharacterized protein MAM_07685 [Metarhizium album ARSEF 1941]KHN94497.1 hypothetical protein MAM_07685 [Metarhizium album ARSEF 1941]
MNHPETTISNFQETLDAYIKPREQFNYIRRILALELGSYTGDGPIQHPLSLNVGPIVRDVGAELKGLHKQFIEALIANSIASQKFQQMVNESTTEPVAPAKRATDNSPSSLEEHLALLKLRQKHQCLVTIQSYLHRLSEAPEAAQNTVGIEKVLEGGRALPSVPSPMLNSFAAEQSAGHPDLQSRVKLLDKIVLQAKLILKREERLLDEARERCKTKPELVSNGAKLQALDSTRNELIRWIEAELSKASTEDDKASVPQRQAQTADDQATITRQLQIIQDKYKGYVAARKELLKLTSKSSQPSILPPQTTSATSSSRSAEPGFPSTDLLLMPYIRGLITHAQQQKALVAHKAHITASLGRKNKESCQLLGRLAEESQLLSAYPMKDSTRRRSGIPEIISAKPNERPDTASRVKPWIFACDAAKINTLEAVAEKVEVGQVALENSIAAIHEMDVLLGLDDDGEETGGMDNTEDDMWLQGSVKKQFRKKVLSPNQGDPWAKINGNLGLIGHDNV